jgi:predicted TIM-barrel fold metal-dependent hydrolase
MGPVAIQMQVQNPSIPTITLPPDLDRVLKEREQFSRTEAPQASFERLYAGTAQILDFTDAPYLRWVRGARNVERVSRSLTQGARYVPNQYHTDGTIGFVAGVMRGAGSEEDEAYFVLGLKRESGVWKIMSEQVTPQPPLPFAKPLTADRIIEVLDDAGIQRAVVLSAAFWLGGGRIQGSLEEEHSRVRAENDWVVAQVGRFPNRLVAFCGVNPLRDYAIAELRRCATLPGVRGMKLHFGNSRVDLLNPVHLESLRAFFREANARRMALVVHLWVRGGYGRAHSEVFLNQLLPLAPDVTIQIAHLAGSGGFDSDSALQVFADAITTGDPRMQNVYFDVATDVNTEQPAEVIALIARRLRQIGLRRILFGADTPILDRPPTLQAWATFRRRLPLTNQELEIIAANVAPYLR